LPPVWLYNFQLPEKQPADNSSVISRPDVFFRRHHNPPSTAILLSEGVQNPMKTSPHSKKGLAGRWLDVEETRLVSDLRIMHSKVNELYNVMENLKQRHDEADIVKYADYEALGEDIRKVDETYLWFVKVKERRDGSKLGD
jgi:hypothetical protein